MEILCYRFGPLDGLLERRDDDDDREEFSFAVDGIRYVEDHLVDMTDDLTVNILTPESMLNALPFDDKEDLVSFLQGELTRVEGGHVDVDALPVAAVQVLADDEDGSEMSR